MKTIPVLAGLALLCLASAVQAGHFELLSAAAMESDTAQGGANGGQAVSADGRWVAFASYGINLVAGQIEPGYDDYADVFLHDRQTGTTALVSHRAGTATVAANNHSFQPSISADGRWVAYVSQSKEIDPAQTAPSLYVDQLFLYDRDTGTNTLVTRSAVDPMVESNGLLRYDARISADGNWIVFASSAHDLVPGLSVPQGAMSIFLYERVTGQMTLVSHANGTPLTTSNGSSAAPAPSADGRYVVFESLATNLVAGYSGDDSRRNVFLFDRLAGGAGSMTLVSRTAASATAGAGGYGAVISADGSFVTFTSAATDLVAGQTDTNEGYDAFLFSRATGTNVLVSRSAAGPATAGNGTVSDEFPLQISATGAYVAFASRSSDAVAGQADQALETDDIFVFERATSSLTLASRTSASAVTAGNQRSGSPAMSADGRYIAFHSRATDLVPGQVDPVVEDDVFLFDRTAGTTTLVSGVGGSGQVAANWCTWYPQISADGAVVSYYTWAENVVAGAGDYNWAMDIVLHDRVAGTSGFASRHAPGMASATAGGLSMLSSVSADGRYAVLLSRAENLVPGQVDDNDRQDVFLVDRTTGTITLVSRSAASPARAANGQTVRAAISADGNWIVFNSLATDLVPGQVDTAESFDIFLFERAAGTVTLVSHAAGSASTAGDPQCHGYSRVEDNPGRMAISADGRYVAFECSARNLVAGQTDDNHSSDIFLYDRVSGQVNLVSRTYASATTAGSGGSYNPSISADGRWIAFSSYAADLVAGTDVNGALDIFLHDRDTGVTLLASRAAGTAATTADGWSDQPALSADGRHLAFISEAANLVPGQTEALREYDVFLFDGTTGTVELISRAAGSATAAANNWSSNPAVSADGLLVAFISFATDLLPGQTGPARGVFVHDRTTRKTELISHSGASRTASLGKAGIPVLSADGRYVAFASSSLYVAEATVFYLEDGPLSIPAFGPGGTVFFNDPDHPSMTVNDFNNGSDVYVYVPSTPAGSDFYTILPCRLVNTQTSGEAPVSGETSLLDVHGACGVPETATAVAVNVTVLQSTGSGRLSVHPGNLLAPGTSTINFRTNQTLANNAILPLAFNGEGTLAITPFVNGGGTVQVILDVSGYFQ